MSTAAQLTLIFLPVLGTLFGILGYVAILLPSSKSTSVLIFSEGRFADISTMRSLLEARAYAKGVMDCASKLYGGHCTAYVLPHEDDLMRRIEHPAEVTRALKVLVSSVHSIPVCQENNDSGQTEKSPKTKP
jgi:hypothetical protein